MFLANLSRRERLLAYTVLGVFSFSLIYNFILKPLAGVYSKLNRKILNKEIELKKNTRLLQQEQGIKAIFQKYTGTIKSKRSDEEEIVALLNEVEKLARASGIHIANIKPKPVEDLSFCNKYTLEMNCEATLKKYIEFIYKLQDSRQTIRVEKLDLTSRGKENPLLKARLLVTKVLTTK
ncbi:MAG: hypothetical protein JW714_01025 [Candidatus Omnitrophica bacterium]|nr:hypothetical protein [Candidatus Omnitrophota bacterium]